MDGVVGCLAGGCCPITAFVKKNQLSAQEIRVLEGALRELSNDEIADELGCSSSTVRTYWTRIFQKVGCTRENHVLARIARFAACVPQERTRCSLSRAGAKVATENERGTFLRGSPQMSSDLLGVEHGGATNRES